MGQTKLPTAQTINHISSTAQPKDRTTPRKIIASGHRRTKGRPTKSHSLLWLLRDVERENIWFGQGVSYS